MNLGYLGRTLAMMRRSRKYSIVLGLALAFALVAGSHPSVSEAQPALVRLDVTIGKSQVLDLQEPFTRVSVTNPAIADVFVVTPSQILVNGKAVGTTSLVVFYPSKTMFFDLVVQSDLVLLRERLKQAAPRDEIDARPAQDAIILTGSVTSERTIAAASEVAAVFAPKGKVVNLLSLTDAKPQQVMLQVHVAEVDRAALKEFGLNFAAKGDTVVGSSSPGTPFFGPLLSGAQRAAPFLIPGASLFAASNGLPVDFAAAVRALSEKDLLRTLAKPNLVTQSGKEAKFLSGGEFPYPVAQSFNAITIEFKEFGVGLIFTPVVVDGETINLQIRPEVSSLDFSQGLQSAGINIPTIRKNEVVTSISIKDGESFAIAGLINNEVRQSVGKVPLLGDIPILGALFRSTRFRNNETELLFLVTVKLVQPNAPGTGPDATKLMDLRPDEKKEFTLVPGLPGVGEVVTRPFGKSNLPTQ
jgi:pilus assembly protein CpaC